MGVVNDEQLQVIIGPGKSTVANAMVAKAGVDLGQEIPPQNQAKRRYQKTAEMKAAQKPNKNHRH